MVRFDDDQLRDLAPMLGIAECAGVLGCSGRTIARMCERGELKACRAGNRWRVNRDSLLAYAGLEVTR